MFSGMSNPSSPLKSLIAQLTGYTDDLLTLDFFRARVHIADHCFDVLDAIETEVQRIVKTTPSNEEIEREAAATVEIESPASEKSEPPCESTATHQSKRRLPFRNMTLAEATKALLHEAGGPLHGREIERRLKEGGYRTKSHHFQAGMLSAFQRDGSIVNIGGNTWQLKIPELIFPTNGNGKDDETTAEN
jgi:hypothetical protein